MTKQARLEGTEQGLIPEIVELADEYVDVRNQRMDLTKQEVELNARLLAAMHKNNLTEYSFDGKIVSVNSGKEKVKVSSNEDDEAE